MLKTMHLFAGHGGGLLADLILGHTPVVAVEWDGYACQVLRERAADGWFPGLRVWEGDVRMFDPSEYTGSVDCIHAGFPCQDISTSGLKKGVEEGTRSGLYREVLRVASVVRPKQLFLENVSAILSNGLGAVLGDLASMGFDAQWCCLPASFVGASHQRDRWWLLANFNGMRELQPQGSKQDERRWINHGSFETQEVSDIERSAGEVRRETRRIRWKWKSIQRAGRWEIASEPLIRSRVHGIPNLRERIKGLGNAQVPLQAATAYRLLGGF